VLPGQFSVAINSLAGGTTYDYQLHAFLVSVKTGTAPLTGKIDAINNMRALEEIYRVAGMSVRGRH
jgi:predicted dehydrogenase